MKTDIPLDALLKRLTSPIHDGSGAICARAEKEEWSYDDLLTTLVLEEIAHRQQTRLQKLSRRAGFPFLKTIDDFDFTFQSTVRLHLLGSDLSPDFVTEGRSLILAGKSGRGKRIWLSPSPTAPSRTASKPFHNRGRADRRPLRREPRRASPPGPCQFTPSRPAGRRGRLPHLRRRRRQPALPRRERAAPQARSMIFTTNKSLMPGAASFTTRTSPPPSSTAYSSAAACSGSTVRRSVRYT